MREFPPGFHKSARSARYTPETQLPPALPRGATQQPLQTRIISARQIHEARQPGQAAPRNGFFPIRLI